MKASRDNRDDLKRKADCQADKERKKVCRDKRDTSKRETDCQADNVRKKKIQRQQR